MLFQGIELSGVSSNSKNIKPGYAFVAIKGEKADGSDYIKDAIKRGAKLIICEDTIEGNFDVPKIIVEDSRKALSELIAEYYGNPSKELSIIGVTGTNGKTTTTAMIDKVFSKTKLITGLIGTTCIKSADKLFLPKLTTPPAEDLHRYFERMKDDKVRVVTMEASSHGLKQKRLYGIEFDIAVHTNISMDHVNYHSSFQDYVNSKKILFDQLKPNGIAIINSDDKNGFSLIRDRKDIVVIDYGLNNKASITASSLDFGDGISFTLCQQRTIQSIDGKIVEPQEIPVKLKLIGKHNIYNSIAAITCGLVYGIDVKDILGGLKSFKGVNRRAEIIYNKEFIIIDDYSHNPSSYQALFEAIQPIDYNNIHLVCAIRGNRGPEINVENAKIISEWDKILNFKTIITTNSEDVVTGLDKVNSIEKEAISTYFKKQNVKFTHKENLYEAIDATLNRVEVGDIILLTGAQGMDKGKHVLLSKLNNNNYSDDKIIGIHNQPTLNTNILKINN